MLSNPQDHRHSQNENHRDDNSAKGAVVDKAVSKRADNQAQDQRGRSVQVERQNIWREILREPMGPRCEYTGGKEQGLQNAAKFNALPFAERTVDDEWRTRRVVCATEAAGQKTDGPSPARGDIIDQRTLSALLQNR